MENGKKIRPVENRKNSNEKQKKQHKNVFLIISHDYVLTFQIEPSDL